MPSLIRHKKRIPGRATAAAAVVVNLPRGPARERYTAELMMFSGMPTMKLRKTRRARARASRVAAHRRARDLCESVALGTYGTTRRVERVYVRIMRFSRAARVHAV